MEKNTSPKFISAFSEEFSQDILELSDGQLRTEDGHTFHIHKIELVKNSEYFYRMFCGAMGKCKQDFLIPGIRGEILGIVISFIYSGKVNITESNVGELLEAADYLLLDDLIVEIKNVYMRKHLTVTNCMSLFFSALKIDRRDVVQECFRYVLTRFETVAAVDISGLARLPQTVLEEFLGNRNLCVRDEVPVWEVIRSWIEEDVRNRQHCLPRLLQHLAVSDVSNELASRILASPILVHNPLWKEKLAMKEYQQNMTSSDVLRSYLSSSGPTACIARRPSHLHFIAHYCVYNQTDGVVIYTSYDEEIDLWRKIVEIDECPEFVFAVGHEIYMFATSENRMMRYSLVDKEWTDLPWLTHQRNYYSAVHLDGLVYVIGGVAQETEEELYMVEAYSRLGNAWYTVSPMVPITSFCSVTIGRKIYVVGNAPHFFTSDMITQAYSAETDSWTLLQAPSVFRFNFAIVGYQGQLYILGGRNEDEYLKNVEVYDPVQNEWSDHNPLPYTFYLPKAIVLNEKLIVYDSHLEDRTYLKTNPALMWDTNKNFWKPFEESSPMNTIHKYSFFSPDNEECTNWIAKENKDPLNQFLKSPFS